MKKIAIIDYGVGNLYSVSKAFSQIGFESFVTSDANKILRSSRVVLPGVGAFHNGMQKLINADLVSVVKQVASSGVPLLGICLGAQLLLESSQEFGNFSGLGIIKGQVVEIPSHSKSHKNIRVPHIGWNNLILKEHNSPTSGTILESIPENSMTYFAHSYMMILEDPAHRISYVDYQGIEISAAIKANNVSGTQFHPEKSGPIGLQIMRNFCGS